MKKKIRKVASLFIISTLLCGNTAYTEVNAESFKMNPFQLTVTTKAAKSDFKYSVVNGNVIIDRYKGNAEVVEIPETIDGKKVTVIGESAFAKCSNIKSIVLPKTIVRISEWAFSHCSSLNSINLPSGLLEIGSGAFEGCGNLSRITIPKGISVIPFRLFQGCTNLTNISMPSSIRCIEDKAFYNCRNLQKINIPKDVNEIGRDAFGETAWLKSQKEKNPMVIVNGILLDGKGVKEDITIPDNVTYINEYAFFSCDDLYSVLIPDGVIGIGEYAFRSCDDLNSITIPKSVKSIGSNAFPKNWIKNQEDTNNLVIVNDILLYGNNAKGKLTIPKGVKSIADGAFASNTTLKSIIIPKGVTTIGRFAFSDCKNLKTIEIPDTITVMGTDAFSGTAWIKTQESKSDLVILNKVLVQCRNTTGNIVIPKGIKVIADDAFNGYEAGNYISSVSIPNSVIHIGNYAFQNCLDLINIKIPASVKSIGEGAFYSSGIESLNLTNGIMEIGAYAFYDCYNLKSVTVPDTLKKVGYGAFRSSNYKIQISSTSSVLETIKSEYKSRVTVKK